MNHIYIVTLTVDCLSTIVTCICHCCLLIVLNDLHTWPSSTGLVNLTVPHQGRLFIEFLCSSSLHLKFAVQIEAQIDRLGLLLILFHIHNLICLALCPWCKWWILLSVFESLSACILGQYLYHPFGLFFLKSYFDICALQVGFSETCFGGRLDIMMMQGIYLWCLVLNLCISLHHFWVISGVGVRCIVTLLRSQDWNWKLSHFLGYELCSF